MKKAAVIVYPLFSMQEISCLTELFKFADKELCVFGASLDPVMSEDGFRILPEKTFQEFEREAFDCLVLPGIWDPYEVSLDERIIDFLRQFQEDPILIASISSSPMLLAKAGLLKNRKFIHGFFEEMFDEFDYLKEVYDQIERKPVVYDQHLITAVGFAFREFAVEVLRALGMPCPDRVFSGITKEYTPEELTFHYMSEEEMFSDCRESEGS